MKLLNNAVLASIFFGLCGNLYAGQASLKLSALTESLIKGYQAKTAGKATLAVFPLICDSKLEKQRVGFAASELMSHKFVANPDFIVVERGELAKVLSEQKLQASGAVDSESAVMVGKLLGAQIVLLGNINKLGSMYQVNARLVNTETGEVLVSGYEELPVEALEDDARVYLSLVPQEQAIGIYFLSNQRENHNGIQTQTFNSPDYGWTQLNPTPFSLSLVGAGLRYRVKREILADVAYMATPAGTKAGIEGSGVYKIRAKAFRGIVSYRYALARNLSLYAGGGAASYIISINESVKPSYITPTVQFRGEYFVQSRLGVSFAIGYDCLSKTIKQQKWGAPPAKLSVAKLGGFYFEPSLAMYF